MPTFKLTKSGKWRKETKAEVMRQEDIEGKRPCSKCWKEARDNGVYVWPLLPSALKRATRCPGCSRVLG